MQENQLLQTQVNQSVSDPAPTVTTVATSDQQPKPNRFLIILLSIISIISLSIAGFFAFQTQKLVKELTLLRTELTSTTTTEPTTEPVTTGSSEADPTANWKTVKSKYWTFKVPKEWYFIKCLDDMTVILGPNLDEEFRDVTVECNFGVRASMDVSRITGDFTVPITTTPDQNGIYTIVSNKKSMVINGRNALLQTEEIHGNPEEGTHTAVYFKYDAWTDSIRFWDSNKNISNAEIDQILSTFKFTN